MVQQIIETADQYKAEFYSKRSITIENNKKSNREKEKVICLMSSKSNLCFNHSKFEFRLCDEFSCSFDCQLYLEIQEKFYAEADKNSWKAIAELIPREVPVLEKKGKKKQASVTVMQGPKPGKPTDLSRMRQVITRLKHSPPSHMKPKVPTPSEVDP